MQFKPVVHIVDDDPSVRHALEELITSVSLPVQTYGSADEFLRAFDPSQPGCLIVDVRMPGMSGLELLDRLVREGVHTPALILTGYADVPMAVRALKSGAFDFIEKPFTNQGLLDRINRALTVDAERRRQAAQEADFRRRHALLTPREQEVMQLLLDGKNAKGIGSQLHVSHKTVQIHRGRIMAKMGVDSVANLIRVAAAAGHLGPALYKSIDGTPRAVGAGWLGGETPLLPLLPAAPLPLPPPGAERPPAAARPPVG